MPTLSLQSFRRATSADVTKLVSIRPDGIDTAGDNEYPSVSGDGLYVTFQTNAQLTADDVDAFTDVYVRDLQTGTLTRASASAPGGQVNNMSYGAHISADGRYVVFSSSANLIPDDQDAYTDIYLRDLRTGSLTRISTKLDGTQGGGSSDAARISADGRYVVFESMAKLVDTDTDTNRDIYFRDLQTGALTRVSTEANGDQDSGSSRDAEVSDDGRFVVFTYTSPLVADATNGKADVYVRDLWTQTLTRVSSKADGAYEAYSDSGHISADGHSVVFETNGQLTADDHNVNYDIYLRNLQSGVLTRLTKTPEGLDVTSSDTDISPDGH